MKINQIDDEWKITKVVGRKTFQTCFGIFLICFILLYFYGFLFSLSLFSVFILAIFYHGQDNLLFHPLIPQNSKSLVQVPSTHNLPFEDLKIRTPDNVMIHMFWIKQPEGRNKKAPTIIYLHGNAGNMGHRMKNVWGFYTKLNCNILMIEYRGYGLSTGSPSEYGLIIDAKAALNYLFTRDDLDHEQIILFGRSLGGAVAIAVAHDEFYAKRLMAIIVENTFTNIPEISLELIHPYIKYVPTFFYKNQFNSLVKVRSVNIPILFISGLNDTLVPPKMMFKLFQNCSTLKKRILQLEGGNHNDTWTCDSYYPGIGSFLEELRDGTILQELRNVVNKQPKKDEIIYFENEKSFIQNV